MAATICIGGICIPVYALLPFVLMILQGFWNWFRKNVLGQDDQKIPENTRVIHVTSEQQFKELIAKGKTTKRSVVVDFTATWCGPCRYISPVYHELSAKYPCSIFLKVDVDELKSVSQGCGVTAMPTFQFFRGGVKCDEMRGADRNGLEALIQKHYVEVELPEDEKPVLEVEEKKVNGGGEGLRQRKPQVTNVETEEQWEQLMKQNQESNTALVVDFWATWCKPCVEIAPFFEEMSGRFATAVFARVDVDELEVRLESLNLKLGVADSILMFGYLTYDSMIVVVSVQSVAEDFNVSSLPSFKVFKGGKVVDELNGAIKSALESMVAKHA